MMIFLSIPESRTDNVKSNLAVLQTPSRSVTSRLWSNLQYEALRSLCTLINSTRNDLKYEIFHRITLLSRFVIFSHRHLIDFSHAMSFPDDESTSSGIDSSSSSSSSSEHAAAVSLPSLEHPVTTAELHMIQARFSFILLHTLPLIKRKSAVSVYFQKSLFFTAFVPCIYVTFDVGNVVYAF
jgi:hypothetical protein